MSLEQADFKDITHTRDRFTNTFISYLYTLRPSIAVEHPEWASDEYIDSHLEDPEFMDYYKTTQEYQYDVAKKGKSTNKALYTRIKRLTKSTTPSKDAHDALKEAVRPGYIYIIKYELPDGSVKNISITLHNIDKIFKSFNEVVNEPESIYSDTSIQTMVNAFNIVSIYKKKVKPGEGKAGSYFPYINTSKYNLKTYQIISNPKDIELCKEHCLIYALRQNGILEDELNLVKPLIRSSFFESNKLSKVADVLKRNIELRDLHDKQKSHHPGCTEKTAQERPHYYPLDKKYGGPLIRLAYFMDHYFMYNKANIAPKGEKDNIVTSLKLIADLYNTGYFKPHECFNEISHHFNHSKNTDIDMMHQSPYYEAKEKDDNILTNTAIIFADTEAYTNSRYLDKDNKEVSKGKEHEAIYKEHKAYRHGFVFLGSSEVTISSTLDEHLKHIYDQCKEQGYKSAIIYYHNLKYDFTLMKKECKFKISNMTCKSGTYYELQCIINKDFKIYLRDSYKLIPHKLEEFAFLFKLDECKQDHFLYDLYDKFNITYPHVSITYHKGDIKDPTLGYYKIDKGKFIPTKEDIDVKKYIILDNKYAIPKEVVDHVNKILPGTMTLPSSLRGIKRPGMYYHMRHCDFYLKYDCLVLQQGISIFRDLLFDKLGIETYNYLTVSSLAHNYALSKGAYEQVWGINNSTRKFVTKCMAGGRVCTRYNSRHVSFCRVEDYDGVSLYPSAMKRLCDEIGLPACPFREIRDARHFKKIKNDPKTIYYFVEIEALQDTKEQGIAFPRIQIDDKIIYTNKIKGKTLYLGKVALEDLENFCDLSLYTFKKGIYWKEVEGAHNKGRNRVLGDVASDLFKLRLQAKKDKKKALDTALKLALNSLYGKNMLGFIKTKHVCRSKKSFNNYIKKNYANLQEYEEIGDNVIYKLENSTHQELNNIHIACMILDMSKRIMNEVIDLADSLDIVILYTDTDSMHIINDNEQITKLEVAYKEKYNKVLNGDQLCQFHCDFNLPGATDIHACKTIIVDKKVYYDKLEGTDSSGNLIYDEHYRFKGVNEDAIKEQEIVYLSKEKIYLALMNGVLVPFELCSRGKPCFLLNGLVPLSRTSFIRSIKFDSNIWIHIHRPGQKVVKVRATEYTKQVDELNRILEDKKETLDNPAIYGEVI